MALFPPLATAREALLAHQRSLQVTGHNIANVNTPGFSRQRATLRAVAPSGDAVGSGTQVVGVERIVDQFIDARRLANASSFAGTNVARDMLQRLESNFPVNGGGIGSALQELFAAANTLATHPESSAVRADLLAAGESVALQIRSASQVLQTMQREVDTRLHQEVADANTILARIAGLNRQIVAAQAGGASTNDLLDARQESLRELAGTLEINVVQQDDGSVSVFAASGTALVLGANATVLDAEFDGTQMGLDGVPLSRVGMRGTSGAFIPLGGPFGGTLGAFLTLRDQTLVDDHAQLDLLAAALRDCVNAVQTDPAGRDLDGLVGTAFFAGTGAADLTVALVDPRGIAAAQSANPGDNANALALVTVQDQTFPALGGRTLNDFFGALHSQIGAQSRAAADQSVIQAQVREVLDAQRDSISGVSLEEEFTELIRVQRAFQAAAQLIAVSDRILEDLLGVIR
jgi:flagellar hook-associated protein 1 FlgK